MQIKSLDQYSNPFDAVKEFECMLQQYTGAPYAIVTDSCTHAIEIALRINLPKKTSFPCRTYLSVVMLMHKLNINYQFNEVNWFADKKYNFTSTHIWDCARYFKKNMYEKNQVQCISFNREKPLSIGKGGAILTDDPILAERANRMRYDGRDIFKYKNWIDQEIFEPGFHYYLRPEECIVGMNLLSSQSLISQTDSMFLKYPDCSTMKIVNDLS
jgi:dTDP-4-amino-4,6-dideoxygalactose transaminase